LNTTPAQTLYILRARGAIVETASTQQLVDRYMAEGLKPRPGRRTPT
jgi:hypothetical protein